MKGPGQFVYHMDDTKKMGGQNLVCHMRVTLCVTSGWHTKPHLRIIWMLHLYKNQYKRIILKETAEGRPEAPPLSAIPTRRNIKNI
jgi:hypothetical protein